MIRQLKSVKQIEALLAAELSADRALVNITPKVAVTTSTNSTGCNWDVAEWIGLPERTAKLRPHLSSKVAELQRRYKAIPLPQSGRA